MLIQTKNKNRYYFSEKKKEVILLSPVLLEIIAHKGDMASLSSTDTETVSYYQKKYALLKEAGYFDPEKENKDERITRDLLERALANSTHVIFETTENCNLKCKYCGYSEIYSTFEQRGKQELPFAKAKTFLDFMLERWNSPLNVSYNKRITLSFYGGEPLMNFPFIEQVVNYVSTWKLKNNYISFSMTTNGTLLDKYIDFLVKWKFNLFISIDGNKFHNAFRVYSNGKESFEKVFENISLLKKRYPSYFKKNVNFNSVFHKRSSYVEVSDFFQKEFDKSPLFLPLNTFGVIKEKEKEFEQLYKNPTEALDNESVCHPEIKEKFSSANAQLISILNYYDSNLFADYNALRFDIKNAVLPTGTCIPFQNRIYVTTSGKLLPCERVGSSFVMGEISDKRVDIDFEGVAEYYNDMFKKVTAELCDKCKNVFCKSCLFTMKENNHKLQCRKFLSEKGFNQYVTSLVEEYEENPHIITNFIASLKQNN